MLEDLAFPAEIVGKRIRIKLDGSRLIKVHLDKNQQTNIEHKVRASTCMSYCPIYQVQCFGQNCKNVTFSIQYICIVLLGKEFAEHSLNQQV